MTDQRTHLEVDLEMLPILGEPFAVEFANTRYDRPGQPFDFLGSVPWMLAWFDQADTEAHGRLPRSLDAARQESIRSVRDAVHSVLLSTTHGRRLSIAAIDTLNRTADVVPHRFRLEWSSELAPVASVKPVGRGIDATIASIAIACITFVASPLLVQVRHCDGPDCPMFFVQQHHKRRFCHDGCSHRARQSRYYRNHHHPGPTGAAA